MIASPDTRLACTLCPSPNFRARRGGLRADMLMLHYTGMASADGALRWLCAEESQVSCHYFVFEDGAISQLVAENQRAWHAGRSCWAGESDINSCSIGIEVAYPGPADGVDFRSAPPFPSAQMEAIAALCRDIVDRNAIAPHRVLAHSDVAPGRKIDPGDRFDWDWLSRQGVGLRVDHKVPPGPHALQPGQSGDAVRSVQEDLARFGYCVAGSGTYDETTAQVITALQRHYRQERVDGCVDQGTIVVLESLNSQLRGIVAG